MTADQQKDGPIKPRQRLLNKSKTLALGLLIVFASLLVFLTLLATTESGTRWLVNTALNRLEQVSAAEINGTLVNDLSLNQIQYKAPNQLEVSIADFNLQWQISELLAGHLHFSRLYVNGITVKGQAAASEESKRSSEIPKTPLHISIGEIVINQISWINDESQIDINKLQLSANLERNDLTISNLQLDMPEFNLNANGMVQIQSDWPLSADINWSFLQNDTALNGHLAFNGDINRFDIVSQIQGAIESSQTGFISFSGDQPEFNFQSQWHKLQWPFAGTAHAISKQGEFFIQGTTQHYQSKLNAVVSTNHQSDFSITLDGNGNQHSINIEQLLLKPAQGQVSLTGQLSWYQEIAFNLAVEAKKLNPVDFSIDIPGKLDVNAQSRGTIKGDDINIALNIEHLSGIVHGQPLNADGKVTFANQKLDIQQLNVAMGSNRLEAQGWLNEKDVNLHLNIKAPDLSTAWPSLSGNLKGETTIEGSLTTPVIKTNLHGNNLRFTDNQIGELSLLADYVHASEQQSILNFSAKNIQFADNKINRFILQGRGNQNDHNAHLKLISPLANLDIKALGEWNGKQWLGNITQLDIDHPQLLNWHLKSASSLTLTQSNESLTVDLQISCLTRANAHLCIAASGSTETQLNGQLSLSALPLAYIKKWLPEELDLTGSVSAKSQFTYAKQDTTANLNATISDGQAFLKDDNHIHKIPFREATIKLNYQQDELDSQVDLGLGKQDHITAAIIAGKTNQTGARQLSGSISANIVNMTLMDSFVSEIDKLQGHLIADLQINGSSRKPIIIGTAEWKNGQFEIAKLGNTFHNIDIKLNSKADKPERLMLNAHIESGKGKLSAQGHLDLLTEHNFPLHMSITGEKFHLSRLPEAELIISPNLTFNKFDKLTKIDGLVIIDRAQIEIKKIPENAVAPSEDEVIITSEETQKESINMSRFDSNIDIHFGDNTDFSGFGLETGLAGKLQYIAKEGKQIMQGRAEMREATYRSYGQDLSIRNGEFVFNGPADNPWLNIEAIRKATDDDVTAILAVTGPLKSPKTRIYTEPSLPETEALAYLVTGKSLKGMSKSEGNAVANAAFSYGVGQLSWISDQLGIDEFEFKQSNKIENSAVKLGQYLNPDLYVGVTMGLFANKYAVNLRYRLSDHFSIDTRAGETQRIDLKYHLQIE